MEEWKEYKLGEFVQFNPKERIAKGQVTRKIAMDQLVPFCRDVSSNTYEEYKGGAKFKNGDTIMARITPCLENGKTCYISSLESDEVAFGSTEYIVLRNIKNISDSRFIYYLSICPQIREVAIKSMVGSSGRQRVQQDVLENFCIKLPPLPTQQKIANILSSLDDKIEVNRRINEQLEELAQALFKSWFVDFEPFKDGAFVESELGMIPEGWKVGKFTDIVEIKGGGTPKTDIAEYWNGDIPFFTPKDVNDVFCISTEKNITDLGLSKCSSKLYNKNTVFITARGTVGKVCMAGRNMAMNQTCYALIGKEIFGQHYIYMQTISIVERIKKKANGAVFSAITTRDFDSEKIIIPSLEIVNDYLMKIEPLYESILHNQQEIHHLTTLRDTLLPKLMSGEIDVSEVEV